jgi:3-hydroxyacyl-CoA dehydrogenase
MYALMREAFHLVEAGYATIEDVDRSIRNDLGYWITFAGPFRFMDLTGIPAYAAVMRDLFPELDCSKEVPALMRQMVDSGAQGVSNAKRLLPLLARPGQALGEALHEVQLRDPRPRRKVSCRRRRPQASKTVKGAGQTARGEPRMPYTGI